MGIRISVLSISLFRSLVRDLGILQIEKTIPASNMANVTLSTPQLPAYSLRPVPPLLPWLSDFHLSLVLPVAAYWLMSLIFWYISERDLFRQYRLHTPAEFKQRNRVSAREVLRSVLIQQAVQTALGLLIGYLTSPGDSCGSEQYDVAVWAGRVRSVSLTIPWMLRLLGIDVTAIWEKNQAFAATASAPSLLVSSLLEPDSVSGYAAWEMWAAKAIYWVGEPAARFGIAIFFSDTWQYFWHRLMHSNQWMYRVSLPPLSPFSHLPFFFP